MRVCWGLGTCAPGTALESRHGEAASGRYLTPPAPFSAVSHHPGQSCRSSHISLPYCTEAHTVIRQTLQLGCEGCWVLSLYEWQRTISECPKKCVHLRAMLGSVLVCCVRTVHADVVDWKYCNLRFSQKDLSDWCDRAPRVSGTHLGVHKGPPRSIWKKRAEDCSRLHFHTPLGTPNPSKQRVCQQSGYCKILSAKISFHISVWERQSCCMRISTLSFVN